MLFPKGTSHNKHHTSCVHKRRASNLTAVSFPASRLTRAVSRLTERSRRTRTLETRGFPSFALLLHPVVRGWGQSGAEATFTPEAPCVASRRQSVRCCVMRSNIPAVRTVLGPAQRATPPVSPALSRGATLSGGRAQSFVAADWSGNRTCVCSQEPPLHHHHIMKHTHAVRRSAQAFQNWSRKRSITRKLSLLYLPGPQLFMGLYEVMVSLLFPLLGDPLTAQAGFTLGTSGVALSAALRRCVRGRRRCLMQEGSTRRTRFTEAAVLASQQRLQAPSLPLRVCAVRLHSFTSNLPVIDKGQGGGLPRPVAARLRQVIISPWLLPPPHWIRHSSRL